MGLALLVEKAEQGQRKLLLEFDSWNGHRCMPQHQRFRVTEHRMVKCIDDAIAAGWEPDSRGKIFRFDAGPLQRE